MSALSCEISRTGRDATIVVHGILDGANHDRLVSTAAACMTCGATVTLDCSGISFMDSHSLVALLEVRRLAIEAGTRLELAAPPAVTRVLVLSGVERYFTITDRRTFRPSR